MTTYTTNTTLADIAERVRTSDRIAMISHDKPDGDALGSLLALGRAMQAMGKHVDIFVGGPTEPNLMSLAEATPIHHVVERSPDDTCDTVVVVDTGSWPQVDSVADWLKRQHNRVVLIDHHSQGDADIAPLRYIDTSAPATTVIIAQLLDTIDPSFIERDAQVLTAHGSAVGSIAEVLFLGLATDTGWFRHGNTNGDSFRLAARLIDCGVDHSRLYQIVEEAHRPQRLAMLGQALQSMRYAAHGEVAVMALRPTDFDETGGVVEELTGLVNVPLAVDQVRLSVLLTQTDPGRTKLSLRSKPVLDRKDKDSPAAPAPPTSAAPAAPTASELAKRFGGGGHEHAAGARVDMDIDDAVEAVIKAVEQSGDQSG